MAHEIGFGNFIDGSFINAGNISLTSKNPSDNFKEVFSVKTELNQVDMAIEAARRAHPGWAQLSLEQRIAHLLRLKAAFIKHEAAMAQAISNEMGKILSESLTEAKGLSARIDLTIDHGLKRIATEELYDQRGTTRYHDQGVLAIIGPFNFPSHLINTHAIPSIVTGNTVVIKPSDICPQVAEIYGR